MAKNNRLERIFILAETDFKVRYYGSFLGLAWAFLNPFARLLVYYFAFSYFIFKGREPDFILYLFLGITTWTYFSQSTKQSIRLINSKRYLLENVQVNKIDIFLSHAVTNFIGLIFNLCSYVVISTFFQTTYSWNVIYILPILLALYISVVGMSIMLSVLYIFFKDLDHVWDIVLLLGFWTVPIIWNQEFLYSDYEFLLYSNPITGLLINIRNIALYNQPIDGLLLIYDLLFATAIFFTGKYVLDNYSSKIAEIR